MSALLGAGLAARSAGQPDQLRNLLVARVEDVRVVLVKLAEELHRAHRLRELPDEERRGAALAVRYSRPRGESLARVRAERGGETRVLQAAPADEGFLRDGRI